MKGNATGASSAEVPQRLPQLIIALLGGLLLWFCFPTIASLVPQWQLYSYTHGYLVVAATAMLIVVELRRAPLQPFRPSWAGIACLLALALITLAAHASTALLAAQMALPALCLAAVWSFAGAANARRFLLPLSYLYFAIPIWDAFSEPLRRLTVRVVSAWIHTAGFPAFVDGNLIHLPSGTFEVAEGCGGLRFAMISTALGVFVGIFHRGRWRPTVLFGLLGLALAMVTNWVRVFGLVLVGYLSEMQHPLVAGDHYWYGWVLFVLGMVPLFLASRRLQPLGSAAAPDPLPRRDPLFATRNAVTYAVGVILALGISLNYVLTRGGDPPLSKFVLGDLDVPGWNRVAEWQDARRPVFPGTTAEVASWYTVGANRVGAYLALYAIQRQGQEVVFADNRPQGQSGTVIARQMLTAASASGALPFEELEIADVDTEHRLVWIGLRVGGEPAESELAAKALQIFGAVRGRRDAQALVLTATCAGDCGNARALLSRYAGAVADVVYAQVEHSLPTRQASHAEGAAL